MVKVLFVKRHNCEELLGQFLDERHYETLIDSDTDVYLQDEYVKDQQQSEDNCILKFRKGYFTKQQQLAAYDGLSGAAKPTQNRGNAAGPKGEKLNNRDWVTVEQQDIIEYLLKVQQPPVPDDLVVICARARVKSETRGLVWLKSLKDELKFDFDLWIDKIFNKPIEQVHKEALFVYNTLISDTTYANPVMSGIAGSFGRYPRIPFARSTAYTEQHRTQFEMSFPFLEQLSDGFKELLPHRWQTQYECTQRIDPKFYVPKTPFTTITVNKNFRTAAHRDAGDLATGFSNLSVVAKDMDYSGGYLILPEIRAALNIRPGDLALISNHDYIHANTPILSSDGTDDFERISLVCYFREDLLEAGCYEYEQLRYQFVESRRLNPEHPLFRDGWNGVSADMWESEEWYDFLTAQGHEDFIEQYHPECQGASLESLFG